jgi:hypothetical protein
MKPQYEIWIVLNCNDQHKLLGKCHEVCLEMQKEFPELRLASGFVHTELNLAAYRTRGPWAHWWLMDGEEVVDPTAFQYNNVQPIRYEELPEDHPARHHEMKRCPNCGTVFWTDGYCCSEKCDDELIKSMG